MAKYKVVFDGWEEEEVFDTEKDTREIIRMILVMIRSLRLLR